MLVNIQPLSSAPPTFEESAQGGWSVVEKDEGEHMYGDKNFTPRYPVFRQQSTIKDE